MRRFSQISFNRRPSQPEPSHDPVLTAEDEAYFQKVIAQLDTGDPAPLPNDQLLTTSPVGEEARDTPLPISPVEPGKESKEAKKPEKVVSEIPREAVPGKKKRRPWSRLMRMSSRVYKVCINLILAECTILTLSGSFSTQTFQ